MHFVHRLLHKLLRARDVLGEPLRILRRLNSQVREMDIDARQRLGDEIVQLAADSLSILLLIRQNPAGQVPQFFQQAP